MVMDTEQERQVNVVEFLLERIEEDEARASSGWEKLGSRRWMTNNYGQDSLTASAALAECKAKRAIIDVVDGWVHAYCDEDNWYSCGLAVTVDQFAEDTGPGSGCSNEERRGTCDCGLESRKSMILAPMAAVYVDHPDYNQEWKI